MAALTPVNEDKATRYQRQKRVSEGVSLGASILLLLVLVTTGGSVTMRDLAESMASVLPAGGRRTGSVTFYVWLLAACNELIGLPATYRATFLLERRYGLSTQTLSSWVGDLFKSLALTMAVGGLATSFLYMLIDRFNGVWWIPAGLLCTILIVGLAKLGPVLLLPLFHTVRPLERESLRARLLRLAERTGAGAMGVYEWGWGTKTRRANAALVGLGRTRRILVSDTMLSEYSDDEIEVVLAHELAHHVRGDLWTGIVLEGALMFAGFLAAATALTASVGWMELRGPGDVAGLPVLLLAAGGVSLAAVPVVHALSRVHERRADRLALELTRNPSAFVSAIRRLGAQNLSEEHPSRFVQWLFLSHPPIHERIAAAKAFKPGG